MAPEPRTDETTAVLEYASPQPPWRCQHEIQPTGHVIRFPQLGGVDIALVVGGLLMLVGLPLLAVNLLLWMEEGNPGAVVWCGVLLLDGLAVALLRGLVHDFRRPTVILVNRVRVRLVQPMLWWSRCHEWGVDQVTAKVRTSILGGGVWIVHAQGRRLKVADYTLSRREARWIGATLQWALYQVRAAGAVAGGNVPAIASPTSSGT